MDVREHDPFVRKLELKERAEEDVFFAKRDRELLARWHEEDEEEQRRRVRELARMRCPECGARLVVAVHRGVTIEECPLRHGMWLTESEMRTLARRERNSWIARYFYRPKPVV
jgi:hypothetical protein